MFENKPDLTLVAAAASAPANAQAPADTQAPAFAAAPPEQVKKVMDELPSMVGGIDLALRDLTGKPMPFVMVIFTDGGAMHATNIEPNLAQRAIQELAASWGEPGDAVPGTTAADGS